MKILNKPHYYVWYSVGMMAGAPYSTFAPEAQRLGIKLGKMKNPSPESAYKKMVGEFKSRQYRRLPNIGRVKVGIVKLEPTRHAITVSGATIGAVSLPSGTDEISLDITNPDLYNELQSLYDQFNGQVSSIQLRELVRKTLEFTCEGLPMKDTGGVYFINSKFKDTLDGLTELVKNVDGVDVTVLAINNQSVGSSNSTDLVHAALAKFLTVQIAEFQAIDITTLNARDFKKYEEQLHLVARMVAEYDSTSPEIEQLHQDIEDHNQSLLDSLK